MSRMVRTVKTQLERPSAPFRLAVGLTAPGALPLADAARLVFADWHRQADEGRVLRESMQKSIDLGTRFLRFADARGVVELRDLDQPLCARWVNAKHGVGRKTGDRPTPRAMRTRRYVLRQFFITAYVLGLYDENPAAAIVVEEVDARPVRALTDAEADACRAASLTRLRETRLPAMAALALTGASTSELASITLGNLRLDDAAVWVHDGGCDREPRWLRLDQWSVSALTRRADAISAADSDPDTRLLYTGSKARYAAQSSMAERLTTLLKHARIAAPDLRPTSFWMYAADRALRQTGRIEAVAAVLGFRSLDTTARVCGYSWMQDYFPTFDQANG